LRLDIWEIRNARKNNPREQLWEFPYGVLMEKLSAALQILSRNLERSVPVKTGAGEGI
jgi:hypothetical protein